MSEKKKLKSALKETKPTFCHGTLCTDPETGKLDFKIDRESCPPEIIKKLEAQTPMHITLEAPKVKKEEKP